MAGLALFNYGFRPFFFFAGVQAVVSMAIWLAALHGAGWPSPELVGSRWHAHELLFGFVAAAVAGFFLTAVPSWTGRRGFAGGPLVVLFAIWLAGRIAMFPTIPGPGPGAGAPGPVAAAIDLAFLPAVALAIVPSLLRSGNVRNLPLVAVLLLLFFANLLSHWPDLSGRLGIDGFALAVNTLLVLVSLIGGRVVPAFTGNAFRRRELDVHLPPFGGLDRAALAAVVAVLLVDVVTPGGTLAGIVALVASGLHGWRLARWRGWDARSEPIVWVLHVAYLWIPVGLVLKGGWLMWGVAGATAWLHALTAGLFPTMILAVMTRASLGHTGRPLVAPPLAVAAYVLVTICAVARVFGPPLAPSLLSTTWTLAAVLWMAAFSSYCVAFAPILWRPRPDGHPG